MFGNQHMPTGRWTEDERTKHKTVRFSDMFLAKGIRHKVFLHIMVKIIKLIWHHLQYKSAMGKIVKIAVQDNRFRQYRTQMLPHYKRLVGNFDTWRISDQVKQQHTYNR